MSAKQQDTTVVNSRIEVVKTQEWTKEEFLAKLGHLPPELPEGYYSSKPAHTDIEWRHNTGTLAARTCISGCLGEPPEEKLLLEVKYQGRSFWYRAGEKELLSSVTEAALKFFRLDLLPRSWHLNLQGSSSNPLSMETAAGELKTSGREAPALILASQGPPGGTVRAWRNRADVQNPGKGI